MRERAPPAPERTVRTYGDGKWPTHPGNVHRPPKPPQTPPPCPSFLNHCRDRPVDHVDPVDPTTTWEPRAAWGKGVLIPQTGPRRRGNCSSAPDRGLNSPDGAPL